MADADATLMRLVRGNATIPTVASHDFIDCWYENIGSTVYSDHTSVNSQSEFETTVDPDGVYDTDPRFLDTISLAPGPSSALRTTLKSLTWGTPRSGINGKPYNGTYGAYQSLDAVGGLASRVPALASAIGFGKE